METRSKEIAAKNNKNLKIKILPGHFATNHSHINYYVDLTGLKFSYRMAKEAGRTIAAFYRMNTVIDTIVCLDDSEVVGAFVAEALADPSSTAMNTGKEINVLPPATNINNQMIFQDSSQALVWNKHILLLVSSATTGRSIEAAMECLQYYNGRLVGVSALFSAIHTVGDMPVHAIFTEDDLPYYESYAPSACHMCADGKKLDAIVNSFGYTKL